MTDIPTSMRERLARAAADATYDKNVETGFWPDDVEIDKQDYQDQIWSDYLNEIDAILAELAEPTEGMKMAVLEALKRRELDPGGIWSVMIQYIREEGR